MADLKKMIENLTEKTSKLQTVPQQKAVETAKVAEAVSEAAKILSGEKATPAQPK